MEDKNFMFDETENTDSLEAIKKREKEHKRAERYKAKAAAKREKARLRAEKKEQRTAVRRERNSQSGNTVRGRGGLIATVITLGVSTLILASVLAYVTLAPERNDNMLETAYRKSFYDTVAQVNSMDLDLSKALATSDGGAMQTYLVDVAVNSELAENNLQQLPIKDANKFYTTKIVNQVGDYAKYLNKKLIRGEKLSSTDRENLKNLYKANAALKDALQAAMEGMNDNFTFANMGDTDGNALLDNLNELQELSVEYPELIYDGPFSDGRDNREIKGLSGRKITEAEAVDIFIDIFADYSPQNVSYTGKGMGNISVFGVQGEIKGDLIYAQITETGGKLITFSYSGSCGAIKYNDDAATEKALGFIGKTGVNGIKPVWINLSNNVYTINFAPETDGVIIYPDLIKVRVCAETGMIIGLEATGYYSNHTERTVEKPTIAKAQARTKVSEDISVETSRLAVVPTGESTETLCYEFSGTLNGDIYYIYIDAKSGRQVEMFKVINSEEGTLLM